MSPEQAVGGPVDARSDLYSLGVTAFFAATGRLPFESSTVVGYMAQHATEAAPPLGPLAPMLPARFAGTVDRCLAKEPALRFASGEELAHEIGVARGAIVRVPHSLERFANDAHAVGSEAGGYVAGAAGAVLVMELFKLIQGDWLGIAASIEVLMVALFLGLSATRVARLVSRARDLLREGYDHRALRAALELEERKLNEADTPTAGLATGAWIAAGLGTAATAAGLWAMSGDGSLLVVLGIAGAVGAPLVTLRRLWDRLGGGKLFGKLLKGRLGRAIFRIGGIGMKGEVATLPAAGERTEMALGRAIEDLFRTLPQAERDRLGDVVGLIGKLEADALALRARPDDPSSAERLAHAVAALETLRMDLLRLHAGQVSLDELTLQVEAAKKVGQDVDRRLEAMKEVSGDA